MVLKAAEYQAFLDSLDQGYCVLEIVVDAAGRPADYRFLEVNAAFERQTGLVNAVGRTALDLVPGLERHWIDTYGHVGLTGEPLRFVQGSEAMGRWFDVQASRVGEPHQRRVALLFTDISAHRAEQAERRRVEDALRASERRFRLFADTAPAMLWVTDAEGSCTYLSRGWYAFTGQTEADALGTGWLDAVHPVDRQEARAAFFAANARYEPFELEHRVRRHDGVYRWVLDAGRPRLSADGVFEGFIGSVIDIHDRKVAEDRLDLAVTSGEVGLWYCDLPFDKLVWNTKVKEHFGLPPEADVTIDTFYEQIHPDDREPTRHTIDEAIATGRTYDTQYRTVGLDGRLRWIRAIGHAHYEAGRPVQFDGITVDLTELMALRQTAEAANQAKDEFLAMLSHELRNPLAPILTALELLKMRGIQEIERERAIIERQVRHLVGLVDDLLDISRITRGKVELRRERVEIADIVAHAVEISSPLFEQQRHVLHVGVPRGLVVDADSGRLTQAVANLLTNAAKYTEPGGTVTVRAHSSGDRVRLSVRDTGIGIDAEMLPRVFELFVQERQTLARSRGGLGLGLSIVRNLVDLHGGRVHATSEGRGRGSEFTIELPLARRIEQENDPAVLDGVGAGTGPDTRVLVVDDNRDGALLLAAMLTTLGYETRLVYDGGAALQEAVQFRPHVALVDMGLPAMDGFELARALTSRPGLESLRLIAVTGDGYRDPGASGNARFAAHLVKPVAVEQLHTALTAAERPRRPTEIGPRRYNLTPVPVIGFPDSKED